MDLVPKEITQTVLCYVVCGDYEDECIEGGNKPVDIAVCNSSGYLLEIFNKKIINSCYILIEDASKMRIYYKYAENSCKVYYLIKNNNGVMIAVRKCNNILLVVKCFKNVKDFKIFDYKSKGYPQIGIYYFNSEKVDVIELSKFDNIKLNKDSDFSLNGKEISGILNPKVRNNQEENETTMEVDQILQTETEDKEEQEEQDQYPDQEQQENQDQEKEEDKSIIREYLSSKLKGMENFQNELNYELDNLNLMLNNGLKSEYLFPAAISNANIVPSERVISIEVTKTWFRIHNSKWIIGIEFWRFGIRNVNDIKILVRDRDFSSCAYKFFETSDATSKISSQTAKVIRQMDKASRTIAEDEQIIPDTQLKCLVIFVLEIPDFGDKSKLSVGFTLLYEKYQYHTETFRLGAEDLFDEKHNFFHDKSEIALSEDVLACLTISRTIDITLEMRYDLGLSLEDVLSKNLSFKKAEVLGRNYYIKESGYLDGTLVSFDKLLDSVIKWKLRVSVKDLPRLKIFIKALSNELPLPLRIRIDHNISTDYGA